ncbi:hypothetical protein OH76DRAFT_597864 [Lentinus brumalis]|uniref:Uncharacterized protein n=1 Tax=Lentinus brumalis TaxID=2498619 RepID=A0A371DUD2_9APHY|nr:hypothetical protein OH76DRAFT_597864 [Polyporus brumalis]
MVPNTSSVLLQSGVVRHAPPEDTGTGIPGCGPAAEISFSTHTRSALRASHLMNSSLSLLLALYPRRRRRSRNTAITATPGRKVAVQFCPRHFPGRHPPHQPREQQQPQAPRHIPQCPARTRTPGSVFTATSSHTIFSRIFLPLVALIGFAAPRRLAMTSTPVARTSHSSHCVRCGRRSLADSLVPARASVRFQLVPGFKPKFSLPRTSNSPPRRPRLALLGICPVPIAVHDQRVAIHQDTLQQGT